MENIIAHSQYDLMKALAEQVHPADFAQEGMSYFKLRPRGHGVYQIERDSLVCYSDEEFMQKVAGQMPSSQMYVLINFMSGTPSFSFRGIKFYAEFVWKQGEWQMSEYEDFRRRKKNAAELRIDLNSEIEHFKRFLA